MKNTVIFKRTTLSFIVASMLSVHAIDACAGASPFAPVPLYIQSRNIKPNVMFMLDVTGSMGAGVTGSGGKNRITVAKEAIRKLVDANDESVRMGFGFFPIQSRFEPMSMGTGTFPPTPAPSYSGKPNMARQAYHGRIEIETADLTPAHKTKIKDAVTAADMIGYTNNPWAANPGGYYVSMSSALAEITRYYRGLSTVHNNEDPRTNLRNRSTLENKPDLVDVDSGGNVTYKSPIQYPCQNNFAVLLTDGEEPWYYPYLINDPLFATMQTNTSMYDKEGNKIRDYTIPLSATEVPAVAASAFMKRNLNNTLTDPEGNTFTKMNADFPIMTTYTVGFGQAVPLSDYAAKAGGGEYYKAENATALSNVLQKIFDSLKTATGSTVPPSYVSDIENIGAIGVVFESDGWKSTIVSYPQMTNGRIDVGSPNPVSIPTGGSRNLWYKNDSSISKLSGNADVTTFGIPAAEATKFAKWLKGETTDYGRASALPGDVLNGYLSVTHNGKYFVVGANDGMIHLFQKESANQYTEKFAYIPSMVKRAGSSTIGKALYPLTQKHYGKGGTPHRYFVDGGAFYRGTKDNEHFVAGATGRGGAGIYALDMALADDNPNNIKDNTIAVDITNDTNFPNLGYTVATPIVTKISDGSWVTLFGNGYNAKSITGNSNSEKPTLYGAYLDGVNKGKLWKEIKAPDSMVKTGDNGLSGLAVLDVNNDSIADYAYAGNLQGDLYRINLSTYTATKIFEGKPKQPISAAPVAFKNDDKYTIVFGTGKALYPDDAYSKEKQTVYAIHDDLSSTSHVKAEDLLTQTITEDSDGIRILSSESLGHEHKGWKVDLSENTGERVIYQPKAHNGTIFLSTQVITPALSACDAASGSGYIMSFDAKTGGHPLPQNASFIKETGETIHKAGYKIANGVPSDLGGEYLPRANKKGNDYYGNVVPGLTSSINSEGKEISPSEQFLLAGRNELQTDDSIFSVGSYTVNGVLYEDTVQNLRPKTPPVVNGSIKRLSWRIVS